MKIYGELVGLKRSVIKDLEKYYNYPVPKDEVVSKYLAKELTRVSKEINRVIALLIDRKGEIKFIIIGNHNRVFIPELGRFRAGGKRFRGLRLFQTKLNYEEITIDNLTDLYKLKLDMVSVLTTSPLGEPDSIYSVVIEPSAKTDYRYLEPISIHETDIGFIQLINELEEQFSKKIDSLIKVEDKENAIVVYISNDKKSKINSSITEIKALADTAGINIIDIVIQYKKPNPKTIVGIGKLDEILLLANKKNCDLLIFNHTLSPTQIRILTNYLDEKIIDRNMLILDIFAQHAKSNDGKIKVELAQLKYLAPRLVSAEKAFSRLAGGIGGRGPGETKLEVDKRRIQKKITLLTNKLKVIDKKRELQRKKRVNSSAKIISLIGYTNVGKSTLLNRLTKSKAIAEDKLFATLDTTSRSVKYMGKHFIFNDTVGFINSLPVELFDAFRATIEEIKYSDLILHVVDISDPDYKDKMNAVERILEDLGLIQGQIIHIFNKIDLVTDKKELDFRKMMHYQDLFISAEHEFDAKLFLDKLL